MPWLILLPFSLLLLFFVGIFIPRTRAASFIIGVVLIYPVSWLLWWGLLYFNVISIEGLVKDTPGGYSGSDWSKLWLLAPPVIPLAVFVYVYFATGKDVKGGRGVG